jgi:hypothetical protein
MLANGSASRSLLASPFAETAIKIDVSGHLERWQSG